MHGTVMIFLFVRRSPSAWPTTSCRCRSARPTWRSRGSTRFAYWLFLFGGLIVLLGFLVTGGAAAAGWTGYAPLSERPPTRPGTARTCGSWAWC